MRITLVAPKWNRMVNSYPPLGLAYLASSLEQDGHDVSIVDLGLDLDVSAESGAERIVELAPDLIGVTAMTSNYESAIETARLIKERSQATIVFGGPHTSLFPDRVLAEPSVDYVVFGEGEGTIRELAQAIESDVDRGDLGAINGLGYLYDGEVHLNPPRALDDDLDALPFPARHLLEMERYALSAPNGERMITVLSSRGCPYNCSYCFKGIMGRTYRQRSVPNIMAELHGIVDTYDVRNIYFVDDLFTVNKQRLIEFSDSVIAEGLDIRWQCLVRVDRIDEEGLRAMAKAGCREIHIGIESGNQEMLDRIRKRITLSQVRQAVRWARDAGIAVKGYFMLGLPGDTEETMDQTIRFAEELDLDEAMFSLTTPFPGTGLWEELCEIHPGTVFNADFSKAFYYDSYEEEIDPFMNLSQVPDRRLSELAAEAHLRFWESKRRKKYERRFGAPLGTWIYRASSIPAIRTLGRKVLDSVAPRAGSRFRRGEESQWS